MDGRADEVDELRLRYRYLDLRCERMQRNLRIRAAVNSAIRRSMEDQGFIEVETPMLMPSTPEGAQEFLVPSRQRPGEFYAPAPEPAALQAAAHGRRGTDRYFQIARCLRDEDLRATASTSSCSSTPRPASVTQDDVLAFISEAVMAAAEAVTGERPPRRSSRSPGTRPWTGLGTDKPDLRFGDGADRAHADLRRHPASTPSAAAEHRVHQGAGRRGRVRAQQARTASPIGRSRSAPRGSCG
ncbi:MAG: amino acid--tRNA ligase-related protein [Acidimicrobiales bacterium]